MSDSNRTGPRDALSESVIGAAIEVHRIIGPGLLESAYAECLSQELRLRDIAFEREVEVPVIYKGRRLECGYRIDFMVNDRLVVEIKAVDRLLPVHEAQLLTYLKLMAKPTGLLLNFNAAVLKDGIKRMKA